MKYMNPCGPGLESHHKEHQAKPTILHLPYSIQIGVTSKSFLNMVSYM